jgi:hypothetical protein
MIKLDVINPYRSQRRRTLLMDVIYNDNKKECILFCLGIRKK